MLTLKQTLKALNALRYYCYDWVRYVRSSQSEGTVTVGEIRGNLLRLSHSIEKGLLLQNTRPYFGSHVLCEIIENIAALRTRHGVFDSTPEKIAIGVMRAYYEYHKSLFEDHEIEENIGFVKQYLSERGCLNSVREELSYGGVLEISRDQLNDLNYSRFEYLMQNRHSIRTFGPEDVDNEALHEAVGTAMRSPSSCNRQSVRIYYVRDKACIASVMAMQHGAQGFQDSIRGLLVVAADLSVYGTSAERNVAYIDAGIFVMSLLLALQDRSIGCCALNWCVRPNNDIRLRRIIDMDPTHIAVALVGIGSIPEKITVPVSHRLRVSDIMYVR